MKKIMTILMSLILCAAFSFAVMTQPAEVSAASTTVTLWEGFEKSDGAKVSKDGTIITFKGITYDMNGGFAEFDSENDCYYFWHDDSYDANWCIDGWNTKRDGSGTHYDEEDKVSTSIKTLYAVWTFDDGEDDDEDEYWDNEEDEDDEEYDDDEDDEEYYDDEDDEEYYDDDDEDEYYDDDEEYDDEDDEEYTDEDEDTEDDENLDDEDDEDEDHDYSDDENQDSGDNEDEESVAEEPEAELFEIPGTYGIIDSEHPVDVSYETFDLFEIDGIRFELNGGACVPDGGSYELLPPLATVGMAGDSEFVHWNTKADDTGKIYEPGQMIKRSEIEGVAPLYAIWTDSGLDPDEYDGYWGRNDDPETTEPEEPIEDIVGEEPSTDAEESTEETTQPTTDTEEPSTDVDESTEETTQPTTDSEEPSTDVDESTEETTQPTTDIEEPSTDADESNEETTQPTTDTEEPSTDAEESTEETTQPTTDIEEPTENADNQDEDTNNNDEDTETDNGKNDAQKPSQDTSEQSDESGNNATEPIGDENPVIDVKPVKDTTITRIFQKPVVDARHFSYNPTEKIIPDSEVSDYSYDSADSSGHCGVLYWTDYIEVIAVIIAAIMIAVGGLILLIKRRAQY